MSESEKEQNNTESGTVGPFGAEEMEVMEKVAGKVVQWGMSVPAILFLESSRPFNFLASQVLHFFNPFVSVFLDTHQYGKFASLLEKRESIEEILKVIERKEAERQREDRESERN
jgi:hypothetical protein